MQRALQNVRQISALRPLFQAQSFATGEIGLAGGAPANIYARKVRVDLRNSQEVIKADPVARPVGGSYSSSI